jgi:hypothetical protein
MTCHECGGALFNVGKQGRFRKDGKRFCSDNPCFQKFYFRTVTKPKRKMFFVGGAAGRMSRDKVNMYPPHDSIVGTMERIAHTALKLL